MKEFKISFCLADSEFMTALRLAVGAVCSAADVDVDAAEDLKVCVTESCLILKASGFECVNVSLSTLSGVKAEVQGEGGNVCPSDAEFSLALVSALVSSCDIQKRDGVICGLTLKL